jgi:uncharacterized membrane protein YdbT with pleckstrin-like domain
MSYVARVLQPNEALLCTSRIHPLIYLPGIFILVIAAAIAVAAWFVPPAYQTPYQLWILAAAGIVALLGLLRLLGAAIRRHSTELAVTDHRVIYKTGILARHTAEMNRNKVESVDVEQSIAGRLFGYGTIVLRGTGGSLEPIRNIGDPLRFRSFITAA